MPSRKRIRTEYPGVYYVEVPRRGMSGVERVYYVLFRCEGKQYEEVVGAQYRDGMTPLRASRLRGERIESRRTPLYRRRSRRNRTLNDLWELYAETHAHKACIRGDRYQYFNHIRRRLGLMRPEEIRTLDIDRVRCELLRTLSPQTVVHALGLIKRILRYAVRKELIDSISHIQFEMPAVDNKKTEMLTHVQIRRLLDALDQEEDQVGAAGVRLALATGMRHSAIAALRWADLDFENGFILLRGNEAKNGKTGRIPMSGPAMAILGRIPRRDLEFVFPGRRAGMHRMSFRDIAKRAKNKAGLPTDFRHMHGLRHTFASLLASTGQVDLYTLQKLLTHHSLKMTERYSHLSDDALRRAGTVVEDIWEQLKVG